MTGRKGIKKGRFAKRPLIMVTVFKAEINDSMNKRI